MTKPSRTDWNRLAQQADDDIDTSDVAELDDAFFSQAQLRVPAKQTMTIRLDSDALAWFKEQGAGYQTRINQLLRQDMQAQQQRRR
ncbi:3-oxoacyl-ACP synthase [Pseudomonas putida]|uniref:3-oxoacyl-ACP synthase n=1 Tax=Pseudomonas putida TaxID=303 RepID=A0A4D6XDX7_PSEPU|nr:BrnA antitoxin family protein [Pseudomonas putida]QCI13923.1 3-oxoacyl-ACP synthase [Pseudomonas putida]